MNVIELPIEQRFGVVAFIGAGRAPTYVVLHTGGGGTTMMPGSVVGPTGVQPGFSIVAIFMIVPLVAVTFTGMVISG